MEKMNENNPKIGVVFILTARMIPSRVSAEVPFFVKEFLMKYLSRFIALIVAVFMLSVAWAAPDVTHAAPSGTPQLVTPDEGALPPVATTEQFALGEFTSLWAYAAAQKLPRHEWPRYWKDACVLSGIACTDHAWRKLPVGKVITAPRQANAILADEKARTAKAAVLSAVATALQKDLMMAKEAALRAQFRFMMSSLALFTLTLVSITTFVILRREGTLAKNIRAREIEELKAKRVEHPHILDKASAGPRGPVEMFALPPLDHSSSCCEGTACDCSCGSECQCATSAHACSCGETKDVAPTPHVETSCPTKEPVKLDFKYFSKPEDTPEKH